MYQSIRPGKTWYDTNGKRIQAHAGSILFAENKFWWYGENKEGITGRATGAPCPYWHHGVKLYSSTDLYNWKDEGFAIRESSDPKNPFYPTRIMDRPHILYNEKTKKYVLWAKTADLADYRPAFSICIADDLHDFHFVRELTPTPHLAGDFDLFIKDEKGYIIYENPHCETICRELTEDFTGLTERYSSHQTADGPPHSREAACHFSAKGKDYLLTSGTTGYFPNPTQVDEISNLHGEWKNLGYVCMKDCGKNSFNAQFSSVFKHPFIKDLYIALGDRWLTDLPPKKTNVEEIFHEMYTVKSKKYAAEDLFLLSDENTSEADYVWLPITFDKEGKPRIIWRSEWKIQDFQTVQ